MLDQADDLRQLARAVAPAVRAARPTLITAADSVLLVTTPELASITGAYATIKALAAGNGSIRIRVLVSMAPSAAVAEEAYGRLARVCWRFLGLHLEDGGYTLVESGRGRKSERQAKKLQERLNLPAWKTDT